MNSFPRPFQTLLLACALAALNACTLPYADRASESLEWLRLKHGADSHRAGRWQLPWNASIAVQEVSPAPDASWLPAAQQGVNAMFPAPAGPGGPAYRLLVAWPAPQGSTESPHVSAWEILDMDQYLPDFQDPFALQVALVHAGDGSLVEAARLEISPRWLSGRSAGPDMVRNAFSDLARSFRPAY